MMNLSSPDYNTSFSSKLSPKFISERWSDDSCILDIDHFVKTLTGIKSKGIRPELIGSIITHYASKWVPELATNEPGSGSITAGDSPDQSITTTWMKKRFFVETLIGILPPEKDSIPCNFTLRLLRTANMVGAEPSYRAELEKRVTWQLDKASLKEIMIPSFSHTCGTVLDVELIMRLVKRFINLEEGVLRSGAGLIKVAKLVDSYLAETAVDVNLKLSDFIDLAGTVPVHARVTDDDLYRAVDTYLKAHPGISKQERKTLCKLIDSRKLSSEASLHAAQNDRLPVRAVIQILFTEQTKLNMNRHLDWSGSFSGTRTSPSLGLDPPARCHSKREVTAQQMEIKKLKEEVVRLQRQCYLIQAQMERLMAKNRKGFFGWIKMGIGSKSFLKTVNVEEPGEGEVGFGKETPLNAKKGVVRGRSTPKKLRKSMS